MAEVCERRATVADAPPGSFAGLMDLYERNYMLLRRLLPNIPTVGSVHCSKVTGAIDLHLRVLDRHPYTSDLLLTYRFPRGEEWVAEPDLEVRVYHDARVAEVRSASLRHWPHFDEHDETTVAGRWRANRFLYKWLRYCLRQGHAFHPGF